MAKDVINVQGQDRVVREDTAKAFRGVHWAIYSIGGFIIITAIVFAIFFIGASRDGSVESPAKIEGNR